MLLRADSLSNDDKPSLNFDDYSERKTFAVTAPVTDRDGRGLYSNAYKLAI